MVNVNDPEVFGTVVAFKYEKPTLSVPAFTNIVITDEDGEDRQIVAMGSLAKKLNNVLKDGMGITVTLDGQMIQSFEAYDKDSAHVFEAVTK